MMHRSHERGIPDGAHSVGAFLAPHHPVGEHPTLQFQRDLKLAEHLDKLGFDEFWCGEHHSSGWEMITSPELFLAIASEQTKRIRLGTGVVSLPYLHPFNVAQRIVQLDHMTFGASFSAPAPALPSDARTFGIKYMLLRDRQDEAIGILKRLFAGERITYKGESFQLNDRSSRFCLIKKISDGGRFLDQSIRHAACPESTAWASYSSPRPRRKDCRHCRPSGRSPKRRRRTWSAG